jgi:hypothetical protein
MPTNNKAYINIFIPNTLYPSQKHRKSYPTKGLFLYKNSISLFVEKQYQAQNI